MTETKETGSTFADSILEKVKSIGKKKQTVPYVVRQDDSLWRIATEQLGDGSRYKEIKKLNANIIKDEKNLPVGMLLRMPAR
jgi:nucleoid-associated protein YgaU